MEKRSDVLRIPLNWGWADYDLDAMVEVGDRLVPQRIDVHFPGGGKQPGGGRQPNLDMVIEVVDGVPRCTALTLTRVEGGSEVRTTDLRLVRVEDWLVYIVAACSESYTKRGNTLHSAITVGEPNTAERRAVEATRKRRGPRKIDGEFLAKVADIYREHVEDKPVQAIARSFDVRPRTAAWYVEMCRSEEHGLLDPKPGAGRKKA